MAKLLPSSFIVALRKESVDRNKSCSIIGLSKLESLSARRAWIEIVESGEMVKQFESLSARRAWIEINVT